MVEKRARRWHVQSVRYGPKRWRVARLGAGAVLVNCWPIGFVWLSELFRANLSAIEADMRERHGHSDLVGFLFDVHDEAKARRHRRLKDWPA